MAKYLLILFTIATGLVSCKDDMYDNSHRGPIELSHTSVTVGKSAQTVHIGVTARDASWTVTGAEEWCSVSPERGEKGVTRISVTFTANEPVLPELAENEPENTSGPEDENTPAETPSRTATFTFTSGQTEKTVTIEQLGIDIGLPDMHEEYAVNQAIHEELLNVWYYNGETRDIKADYNQATASFFESYLSHLVRNNLDRKKWSRNGQNYIYSYITKTPVTEPADQAPLNYGMEFDLADYDGRIPVGRILYVEEGSPAASAGLQRGNWFNKVNENQLGNWEVTNGWVYQYNQFIDTLVNPRPGISPELGMLTFNFSSGRLVDNRQTTILTPQHFKANPLWRTQLIETPRPADPDNTTDPDTEQPPILTGYMAYNSFDSSYRDELTAAFDDNFKDKNLTNFILDLRYNKSGSVEMAELMGDLLVPESASGKVFANYIFASGDAAALNRTKTFTPHDSGVKTDTIFILTSRNTAGASELLINALRGIPDDVKLVVIGDVTEGMNVGMVHRTYSSTTHRYDAWIAAFRNTNAMGQGNYEYGFVPNGGSVDEWDTEVVKFWLSAWGWRGADGAEEDRLLRRAMYYVEGRDPLPANRILESSSHQKPGYPRRFSMPANMVMNTEN